MKTDHWKWTEEKALHSLLENKVLVERKLIVLGRVCPGLKLWGALDFLTKKCGYALTK
jgi:hypothetical protein